jgi:hypothetical protein
MGTDVNPIAYQKFEFPTVRCKFVVICVHLDCERTQQKYRDHDANFHGPQSRVEVNSLHGDETSDSNVR